jgi:hypothetical protein
MHLTVNGRQAVNSARPKHRYYVPGIISLAILPLLFIYYASKEIRARTLTVMPIYLFDTVRIKKYPELYRNFNGGFHPKRNYIDIILVGNNQTNEIKLDFAQLRIREILAQNDSSNGVHFEFGDSSEYWTFVKACNMMKIEGAKTFMAFDHSIWFYHFPPDPAQASLFPELLQNDVIYVYPKVSIPTGYLGIIKHIWVSSWGTILGFTAYLLSALVLYRQNKVK